MEPHCSGHRGVWVDWISRGLLQRGWSVSVGTATSSLDDPALSGLLQVIGPANVHAVSFPTPPSSSDSMARMLALENDYHRAFSDLALHACRRERRNFDVVLVPGADYFMHAAAIRGTPFGAAPWVGVVMRPAFHYAAMGVSAPSPRFRRGREWLFRRFVALPQLRRCVTIDQPLAEYLRDDRAAAAKIEYMADPVEALPAVEREEARRRLGLPLDAVVVLVFGSISRRKGLQCLLPAMNGLEVSSSVTALVVGRVDTDAQDLLRSPSAVALQSTGRLKIIDGWSDAAREADAFAASDIVWMGYEGHAQSSGVLIQAGRAGLPVLACDEGIIGWFTWRNDCGLVAPMREPHAVSAALRRLVRDAALRRKLGSNGLVAAGKHTTDRAVATLDRALQP